MRVFRTLVMSVLLYGAETWPVVQPENRRLTTFQMQCLRTSLGSHCGTGKKCSRLEASRGSAHGGAAEAKTTAMTRSCAADA